MEMEKEEKDPKDLNELAASFPSQVSYVTKKKSGLTNVILIVIILAILIAGGIFSWRYFNKTSQSANVNPSSLQTSTPEPTRSLNRENWSFEVLNGSGVTGVAKKAVGVLTSLGYTVIKTGNADKSTYTQNQLYVRDESSDQIDLLLADLKTDFNIASVSGQLKEGTASARLIIGK